MENIIYFLRIFNLGIHTGGYIALLVTIVILIYIIIKEKFLGIIGIIFFITIVSLKFIDNKKVLKEFSELNKIPKEIVEREYINSFEKDNYDKALKEKVDNAIKFFDMKNEVKFYSFLNKNYSYVELLRNKNLTKDEEEYKEKMLNFFEEISNQSNDMLFRDKK